MQKPKVEAKIEKLKKSGGFRFGRSLDLARKEAKEAHHHQMKRRRRVKLVLT